MALEFGLIPCGSGPTDDWRMAGMRSSLVADPHPMRVEKAPRHQANPQRTGAAATLAKVPNVAAGRAVLLLEDDTTVAELLRSVLEMKGYSVRHVLNGVEGLKNIRAESYDLVLCDISMPTFPGDMFYRAVKCICPELCPKFIFMTGHTGDTRITEFVRDVQAPLILKPFSIQELLEKMKSVPA
jgi:CheY-like chemotaxis protein